MGLQLIECVLQSIEPLVIFNIGLRADFTQFTCSTNLAEPSSTKQKMFLNLDAT